MARSRPTSPHQSGEFVCRMEDIPAVHARPDNPEIPLICIDDTSRQVISETREPIPIRPGRPARYDAVYKREGFVS